MNINNSANQAVNKRDYAMQLPVIQEHNDLNQAIDSDMKHIELLNRIDERKARIAENERKARSKLAQEQAWADEIERIRQFKAGALVALIMFIPLLVAAWALLQISSRG